MNPLESEWFFRMIERGGKTPSEKLVAIFSVTEHWIAAPGIRESFLKNYPERGHFLHSCNQLKRFLADLATAGRIEKPEILASHLVILLQGAIVEELRNPATRPLTEAAKAAQAVIARSHGKHGRGKYAWFAAGGIAAGIFATAMVWHLHTGMDTRPLPSHIALASSKLAPMPAGVSPSEMEAILVLHEQIEKGVCPAPQLLVLPPGQMTAYMNIINFRTPDNPAADRENIRAFLDWYNLARSTECYMPPVNGHTTVTWKKG